MGSDRRLRWFEAARLLGRHNIERKPERDASEQEKLEYRRAHGRFQKAVERGGAPQPDGKDGPQSPWWFLSTINNWRGVFGEPRKRGRPKKKKPDSCANTNQAKAKRPSSKEQSAGDNLPQPKRNVNAEVGAVRQ